MSNIETLLDCEDAICEIAQAQVILELLDVRISEHYGSLGETGQKVLAELGYILDLCRDKEAMKALETIGKVMSQERHEQQRFDLDAIKKTLNRQIEEI
jgi:hydrogenase maturation factor